MTFLENRIPPPVVMLLFALLMWLLAQTMTQVTWLMPGRWISPVVWLAGMLFCLSGVWSFRKARTTVNPLKPDTASSLVIVGIYRVSRNPMYVGFVLFLAGWALFLSSGLAWLGVVGYLLYMNRFQIEPEERALQKLFGEQFEQYCQQVRRWL